MRPFFFFGGKGYTCGVSNRPLVEPGETLETAAPSCHPTECCGSPEHRKWPAGRAKQSWLCGCMEVGVSQSAARGWALLRDIPGHKAPAPRQAPQGAERQPGDVVITEGASHGPWRATCPLFKELTPTTTLAPQGPEKGIGQSLLPAFSHNTKHLGYAAQPRSCIGMLESRQLSGCQH